MALNFLCKHLSPSTNLVIRAILPIKRMSYFYKYLEGAENIQLLGRLSKERLQVYLLLLLWFYFDTRNVYQIIVDQSLTPLLRVLHADVFYFTFGRTDIRLAFTAVSAICMYSAYALYLALPPTVLTLYKYLILRKTERVPEYKKLCKLYQPLNRNFRNTSVLEQTRKLALLIANNLQVFNLVMGSF